MQKTKRVWFVKKTTSKMNNTFGCFVMGTIYCDKGYLLVIHYEKNVSL